MLYVKGVNVYMKAHKSCKKQKGVIMFFNYKVYVKFIKLTLGLRIETILYFTMQSYAYAYIFQSIYLFRDFLDWCIEWCIRKVYSLNFKI